MIIPKRLPSKCLPPKPVSKPPTYVWAHCFWDLCDEGEDGTIVTALYETEQTANQARDKAKRGFVAKMRVNTKVQIV